MTDPRPVKHYVRQALELVEAYKALLAEGKVDHATAKLLRANHILVDVIPALPTYPDFCSRPANPFVQSYYELCAVVKTWLPQKRPAKPQSLPDPAADDLTLRFERLRDPRSAPKPAPFTAMPSPPQPSPSLPPIDVDPAAHSLLVVGRQSRAGSEALSPPPAPPPVPAPAPPIPSAIAPSAIPPAAPAPPQNEAVDPSTLDSLIKYLPDLVVVLDVRDRDEFDRCHIDAPFIACLEPVSLRPGMTDADLEDSLVIAPDSESRAFAARRTAKHVVVYTRSGRRGSELAPPLLTVYSALRAAGIKPTLLDGGLDAWTAAVLPVTATTVSRDRSPFKMDDDLPQGDWVVTNGELERQVPVYSPPPRPDLRLELSSPSSLSFAPSVPSVPIYSPPQPPSDDLTRKFVAKYPEIEPAYQMPQPQQFALRTQPQPIPQSSSRGTSLAASASWTMPPVPAMPPPTPRSRMPSPSGLPGPSVPASSRGDSVRVTWPRSQKYHPALSYLTGLANLGNTCYMNCVLQCFEGTPQLAVPFLDRSYLQYVNVKSRLGYQGRMANEFAALTLAMARAGSGGYVAPRGMKNLAGKLNETFAGRDQQDCQEFLVFLLDGLHEDLNLNGHRGRLRELDEREEKVREKYNVRLASTIEWERYLKSDTSLVVDTFQGQYMSRLKCTVCGMTSSTYTAFSTLSLPLAAGRAIDLHQCFAQFVAPEILDGDDAWFCSTCKRKQRAIKTMSISRLPPVLIIHLKRFRRTLKSVDKLETPVSYPLHNLDLTGYWPNPEVTDPEHRRRLEQLPKRGQQAPFRYNLYAVTAHDGSLKSGHYTAFVSKPGTGWCHYDDVHVTRVPDTAAVTNKAYLLFYQRV